MTREEAINYLRDTQELKIYRFQNGFVLVEDCVNSGYNYVIQTDEPRNCRNIDIGKIMPKVGEWLTSSFNVIDENCTIAGLFGYRLKVEVEPIFTDDYLLSTKLEEEP